MMEIDTFPAYAAFQKQLRTLCLKEFPCGAGNWRETKAKSIQQLKASENVDSKYSITLKDYGAQNEKTETLEEYVGSKYSPWHLDYSWSSEAKGLREIAVKSPWLLDDSFIMNHFQTLRIVDKGVTEVDGDLLRFRNLNELTLSANHLVTVNSKNLPPNLKVLELCANKISDLSALCVRPPQSMIHLGLGFNKISFMGDYLTGDYWPQLLSLDLSHNNLTDLLDVVRKLGTLPKLRNLILQGNPLSLIAGYRGYTIDSMRKLSVLDDIMISADERHHYKGLAKRREYILDEAKVTLQVSYIKGLPVPEEVKNPEEQPEFPVIERKYYVQFMFLHDTAGKGDVLEISHDEIVELSPLPGEEQSVYSEEAAWRSPDADNFFFDEISALMSDDPEENSTPAEAAKNVNFTAEPEVVIARDPTETATEQEKLSPAKSSTPKREEQEQVEEETQELQLEAIKLGGTTWAEEVELDASQLVVRDELLDLRNFFKQGMQFSVVEEMTLLEPVLSPNFPGSASSRGSRSSRNSRGSRPSLQSSGSRKVMCFPKEDSQCSTPTKKEKDKEKDKKKDKKDDKAKGGGGKDDKKKKGKKEPEIEMKRMPPTYTTLATWHQPLEEFLEGEYQMTAVYTQGGIEAASTVKSVDTDKKAGKKDDKKKPGSPRKKDEGKGGKESRKSSAAKGGKDDKKGDKGKGAKAAPTTVDEEGDEPAPPPPLEVQISIKLHHWRTAHDSLKEEEEKNRALQQQQQV
ncbi:leucine-rich repeat-containing protein 43-like isoform X3 [Pecten maximus]|uniref:leucine-rich repeat-containing protein 43-like isoform X3 n=1 Tax=Pecten maximus TaxID=6579 RepID=UPI001458793A|nr:leucine-rich repeat-containing protein 43-like isoform X3 [Pecten maximus]